MEKKTLKDYNTVITTASADERNSLIAKLYNEGKEYYYTDRGNDGLYRIAYNM